MALVGNVLFSADLAAELKALDKDFHGRVGVCVQMSAKEEPICNRGSEKFSLQSVMKMIVGATVLDLVDAGKERLDAIVIVKKSDLSVYMQPIAKEIGPNGYRTTVGDLIRRANVDSDSAAVDILWQRIGGAPVVKKFLERKGIQGMRLDRDEKHLQSEISGLQWKPEYVDAALFEKTIADLPDAHKAAAYKKYQTDPRDTCTPLGMNQFLRKLAEGQLLSPAATDYLLKVMKMTATGPDRLMAGTAPTWKLAHKTGTSGSWKGVSAALNDVGILYGPKGERVTVTVFVGDNADGPEKGAAKIARVATLITGGPATSK